MTCKLLHWAALLLVSWGTLGCHSGKSIQGNVLLNNRQFARKAAREQVVLIDVRTPHEYDSARLKNALLLDYKSGAFDSSYRQLDKTKTYLLYCRSAIRSDHAATKMKAAGFKKVYQLQKGLKAWDGPLESSNQ